MSNTTDHKHPERASVDRASTAVPTPAQLLDLEAERLAERHRQRLHRMTRAAIHGERRPAGTAWSAIWSAAWLPAWPRLGAAALSLLALSLLWQLTLETERQEASPPLARQLTTEPPVLPGSVPAWVRDTDVPVAVLENVEFYRWLAGQLQNGQATSHQPVGQQQPEAYYENHS